MKLELHQTYKTLGKGRKNIVRKITDTYAVLQNCIGHDNIFTLTGNYVCTIGDFEAKTAAEKVMMLNDAYTRTTSIDFDVVTVPAFKKYQMCYNEAGTKFLILEINNDHMLVFCLASEREEIYDLDGYFVQYASLFSGKLAGNYIKHEDLRILP